MNDFYYRIRKRPGYTLIAGRDTVLSYLVEGTEAAALIDTGYGFGNLAETVFALTDKPLMLLCTHGHIDHIGGCCQFKQIPYLNPKDHELAVRHDTEDFRRAAAERARHGRNLITGEERNLLPEGFDEDGYSCSSVRLYQPLEEGQRWDLGGLTLEALEMPGHTQGSTAYYCRENGNCFIGDASSRMVWLLGEEAGSLSQYRRTLRNLIDLNAAAYLSGHDPLPIRREDLERYLKTAEEADYERAYPFESFLTKKESRLWVSGGLGPDDILDPEYSAVAFMKDNAL